MRCSRTAPRGLYGLSNELLDTPWPKLLRVRAGFEAWLRSESLVTAQLFALLNDRRQADSDTQAAHTGGLPREWQQVLSAPFVLHPVYGTRCSTVVLLEPDGAVYIAERRFDAAGTQTGETEFRLNAAEWP